MTDLRALVVDDEEPARRRLSRLLAKLDGVEVLGEATDGVDALARVRELEPDVVFLDIEMPRLDGFGVAEALGARGPLVVFVTAYDEHALRAFEASAVDYLVKPVREARLRAAVDKLRARAPAPAPDVSALLASLDGVRARPRFAVKSGSDYAIVDLAEVRAIVAQDHYAVFRVGAHELLGDESLDALAARLEPSGFLRVHRSAIVNLAWLASLEREGDRKYVAVLRDEEATRLPVSRDRLAALKDALGV